MGNVSGLGAWARDEHAHGESLVVSLWGRITVKSEAHSKVNAGMTVYA